MKSYNIRGIEWDIGKDKGLGQYFFYNEGKYLLRDGSIGLGHDKDRYLYFYKSIEEFEDIHIHTEPDSLLNEPSYLYMMNDLQLKRILHEYKIQNPEGFTQWLENYVRDEEIVMEL